MRARVPLLLVLVLLATSSSSGCLLPFRSEHTLYVQNALPEPVTVRLGVRDGGTNAPVHERTVVADPGVLMRVADLDLRTGAAYLLDATTSSGHHLSQEVTAHSGSWFWTFHVASDGLSFSELHGD